LVLKAAAAPAATGGIEVTPAVVKAARRLEVVASTSWSTCATALKTAAPFLQPRRAFLCRTGSTFDYWCPEGPGSTEFIIYSFIRHHCGPEYQASIEVNAFIPSYFVRFLTRFMPIFGTDLYSSDVFMLSLPAIY
jgi:hypothetical protein